MNQDAIIEILNTQKVSTSLIFSIYDSNHKIYKEILKTLDNINQTNKRNFNHLLLLNLSILLLFFWLSKLL